MSDKNRKEVINMREIGSEFWLDHTFLKEGNTLDYLSNFVGDRRLLLSGRAAIDFVLDDIDKKINTVYMPSYCCDSMLQPFIDRGISIEFYKVTLSAQNEIHYSIDINKNIDIFFGMSYFGFDASNMDDFINKFCDKGTIVIEDATHRLLSRTNHCETSTYVIASLRKWFPTPSGGVAVKLKGSFIDHELFPPDYEIIEKKISAMKLKAYYMNKKEVKSNQIKNDYLKLYSEFNQYLRGNYHLISTDKLTTKILNTIDFYKITEIRRKNAKYFYDNFNTTSKIDFLFRSMDNSGDCPLFIPLIVDEKVRDKLREFLTANSIFCPIHWPTPIAVQEIGIVRDIYCRELSIICDQRYDTSDMKKIINILEEFEKQL